MKKYYLTISQQPKGDLKESLYSNPGGNPALECRTSTHFPIIPVIANTADKNEKIRIYAVCPQHENTKINLDILRSELEKTKEEIGFEYELTIVDTPFSEMIGDHLALFGKLIETAENDDMIYADITFGTKPIPMILMMFMTYAYRFKENITIEKIVYGQFDHNTKTASVYDVSALFYMNMTINNMDNVTDPIKFINLMLEM